VTPEPELIVRHNLGLVMKLYDSVSGKSITDRSVRFSLSGNMKPPLSKEAGTYLFLNIPKDNFDFEVNVHGYEPMSGRIDFAEIGERLPLKELFMIPLESSDSPRTFLTVSGKLEGIEEIEAVPTFEAICNVKEFNSRKLQLTLYNPRNAALSQVHYGLLDNQGEYYDKIEIVEEISPSKLILKSIPEHSCVVNQRVMKIIHGQIKQDGTYLLKVAESSQAEYLLRYVVNKTVYFQRMDFHQPEELRIEKEE